jgi:cobalt-zinc-cadmium resistance protein CzcA
MGDFFSNFIKNKALILFFFLIIIMFGVNSLLSIPIASFPDLTNNQVQILTEAPGMPPVEVEQLVTIPVETSMNGLQGVENIRSTSKFGLSVVTVVFKDNVETYFSRQLVNEKLQSVKNLLPQNTQSELAPPTTVVGEIYQYVIEGKNYTPEELKQINDWEVKNQLRTIQGISEINTLGGRALEYKIKIYPEKLIQYGLSLQDIYKIISENNQNFSGGIIEKNAEQYIITGFGRIKSLEDIENIALKTVKGSSLLVKDIAQVDYDYKIRQGAATKDGKGEVVTGLAMMIKGQNSLDIIAKVKDKIKEINQILPEGIKLVPFYDQTNLINQTVNTVKNNLLEGGFLVIAILFFMLGNVRAALIVSSVIPISMMFSFIGMKYLGISANIMSLGAIDFGMIVDGSIVVIENTIKKIESQNKEKTVFNIVQDSLKEIAKPIFFGTLIIMIVYIPILSLEGIEYKMFSPMVFTVSFALIGSLIASLTFVPVIAAFLLKENSREKTNFLIKLINPSYSFLLEISLKYKSLVISLTVLIFISGLFIFSKIGTEFLPKLDEGAILIEAKNIHSISIEQAIKNSTQIEKAILKVPEVENVVSKIGRTDIATDAMSIYEGDVYVNLIDKSKWEKGVTKGVIIENLDKSLNELSLGTNFSFNQPMSMRLDEMISGVKADLAIKIFGEDVDELNNISKKIETIVRSVKGNEDLQVESLEGGLQLSITPDRSKLSQYGLNISDIADITETSIMGKNVSEIIKGKKRFNLRVGLYDSKTIEDLKQLLIKTPSGKFVSLDEVAIIEVKEGLDVINREFGERRIIVQCNIRNRDIGSFVKEAKEKVFEQVKLPEGYYIKWGGQFENQERAMKKLLIVVPASIVIIFLLLVVNFSSVKSALIVILNVPLALTGGIWALYLRGMYLSVSASIGFIALFGVAVLNGIVLISTIDNLKNNGFSISDSVLHGAKERLRPVLMTALVAMFGFLPMAISSGSGAEVQKPLATVVMGGLVTSTMLTLLVLPSIYYLVYSKRKKNDIHNI